MTFTPVIPGYLPSQVIGIGGFSTVWSATAPDSNEMVAVKVGRIANGPETPGALRQLRADYDNEWNALNRIHSENVVRPIARGTTDDDKPYLVLEYVPGATLSEYQQALATGLIPFDLRQVLILMLSAARAMGAMREQNIIHNDIKLSNYRVTEEGRVVLCDLGMAISVEEARGARSRGYRGTPGYVPAQTTETTRKDVFGLGSGFYKLLTGKEPFPESKLSTNPWALLVTQNKPPLSPKKARPERKIPQSIAGIVMTAINRDPTRRYADAIEMHTALEGAARPIIDKKPRRPRR